MRKVKYRTKTSTACLPKLNAPSPKYSNNKFSFSEQLFFTFMELQDEDSVESPAEIGPIFDKRAFCHPRRQPVNIPQPKDATLIYQPMCIQIEKCGGCCSHELFECVPSIKKNATRKVSTEKNVDIFVSSKKKKKINA